MKYFAIDVVLLPPKEIRDKCIQISQEFAGRQKRPFSLNVKDNLPHLSLFMCVLAEKDMPKARQVLGEVAEQFKSVLITLTDLRSVMVGSGRMFQFKAKKTAALQKLHEKIIAQLRPFTHQRATPAVYFKKRGEYFDPITPRWLQNFLQAASFKKFDPHLTLRTSFAKTDKLPVRFKANTLAICHQGDRSTCRKILYQTKLALI
ncbi:MAG: 2'-5' RNA ligase family protein [Candidatus Magasanikbacteria bacterium]|nr:2'-5' RNA ligase family protein [Candidatus Magasanikbacteria bacterium]